MGRPSKFTTQEIARALREVSEGTSVVDICKRLAITETTFYRWRKKFSTSVIDGQPEVQRLRAENHKLKQLVAELLLEKM